MDITIGTDYDLGKQLDRLNDNIERLVELLSKK